MTDDMSAETPQEHSGKKESQDLPIPFDPLKTYLAEVSKYPVLSREKEFEVSRLAFENQDLDAAQRLVMANLRLVVKISLEYYNSYLNILDLIQEGNVGLLHAVKKYNPYKGTKFSTYASFWIRAYILKHIMDSWSLVKVGTTQGQRKLFYRLNKEKQKLEALGVYPEPKVLAGILEVKEEEVDCMQQRLAFTDISLEAPVHDGSDDTIMDTMKTDEDVEEIVSRKEESERLSKKVTEFKGGLNDKEKFIFDQRTLAEEPLTLQEIGEIFQISRERVRQIENKVLKKFKEQFQSQMAKMG
ncbi:MAG TPA: RNA polymerase factor sigma-32 [Syntrophorhabdaceae bacterium]|jgi:RNA polymerase sigma-32 factor